MAEVNGIFPSLVKCYFFLALYFNFGRVFSNIFGKFWEVIEWGPGGRFGEPNYCPRVCTSYLCLFQKISGGVFLLTELAPFDTHSGSLGTPPAKTLPKVQPKVQPFL